MDTFLAPQGLAAAAALLLLAGLSDGLGTRGRRAADQPHHAPVVCRHPAGLGAALPGRRRPLDLGRLAGGHRALRRPRHALPLLRRPELRLCALPLQRPGAPAAARTRHPLAPAPLELSPGARPAHPARTHPLAGAALRCLRHPAGRRRRMALRRTRRLRRPAACGPPSPAARARCAPISPTSSPAMPQALSLPSVPPASRRPNERPALAAPALLGRAGRAAIAVPITVLIWWAGWTQRGPTQR